MYDLYDTVIISRIINELVLVWKKIMQQGWMLFEWKVFGKTQDGINPVFFILQTRSICSLQLFLLSYMEIFWTSRECGATPPLTLLLDPL